MTVIDGVQAAGTARPARSSAQLPVKSASRTIDILEALADVPLPMTLTELARHLGVPKSSLLQLLRTLVDRGWVETDERRVTYRIGLRALRVGGVLLDRDSVVRAANPLLARLGGELGETVHLARLESADIVYLASRESDQLLRVASRIGRRLPAHATSLGRALLAARDWADVDALLPAELTALTSETITDRDLLRAELEETRRRGWALEQNQTTIGLTCVGVVVPNASLPTDALSAAVPRDRLTDEHLTRIVQGLTEAANELAALTR